MRLLSLVVTLLIVALLVYKQFGGKSGESASGVSVNDPDIKVPERLEDVQDFQKKLNQKVLDQADDTARRINEASH